MIFAAEPTWGLMILLLLLTLLAAVVYGVGSAIKHKQPIVAIAWLMVPVGLLLSGAMLLPFFAYISKTADHGNGGTTWSVEHTTPAMPPMPPMPAMPAMPVAPQFQVGSVVAGFLKIGFVLLVVLSIVKLVRKRGCSGEKQSSGWGKTAGMAILVLAALALVTRFSAGPTRVAQGSIAVPQERMAEAQQQMEEAQRRKVEELLNSESMQEMWEKLNKPRIKLESDDQGTVLQVGDGTQHVSMAAPAADGATLTVPLPEKTPESLAKSLARLEKMVEQASAVADQVSEAGTLVGKAMIALNETIDSRSRGATVAVAATPEQKPLPAPPVAALPVAHVVAQDADKSTQRTAEIVLDRGKLNQYQLSFDKIRTILGRDGYWRGTAVRFNIAEGHIAVTGKFPADYEARLGRTLLGPSDNMGRPIHLSDVATISAGPDSIVIGVAADKILNGAPPAWVHAPQKKVGNTQRVVIEVGDFATSEECYRAADEQLKVATIEHLQQFAGVDIEADENRLDWHEPAIAQDSSVLNRMGIGVDFIRREIARDEYFETVERSVGPMKKLYTLLEFTPSVDAELMRRWNEVRRQERFAVVGVGAGSVLGMIGLAFGLLKADTWTKGYYTKRLFLGVPAAIIGMLALLGLAAG